MKLMLTALRDIVVIYFITSVQIASERKLVFIVLLLGIDSPAPKKI